MGHKITWNWRREFDEKTIKQGEQFLASHVLYLTQSYYFYQNRDTMNYEGTVNGVRRLGLRKVPRTYAKCAEYNEGRGEYAGNTSSADNWLRVPISATSSGVFYCSCKTGLSGQTCKHMAAMALQLERSYPNNVVFEESYTEQKERLARQERERRERERALGLDKLIPSESLPADAYFPLDRYVQDYVISPEAFAEAEKIYKNTNPPLPAKLEFSSAGEQQLRIDFKVQSKETHIALGVNGFNQMTCQCGSCNLRAVPKKICRNLMLGFMFLQHSIVQDNPGDMTDRAGQSLIQNLTVVTQEAAVAETGTKVHLTPFLEWFGTTPKLRFSFEHPNGKTYIIKGLSDFVRSVMAKGSFFFTPSAKTDFSTCWFDEESAPFYQLLESEYGEIKEVPRLLNSKSDYQASAAERNTGIYLKGSILDAFYDAAAGMSVPCETGEGTRHVKVGYHQVQIQISLEPEIKEEKLSGVRVKGNIPVMLEGATYRYTLDKKYFSRVLSGDLKVIAPYARMFGQQGSFDCVIGQKTLPTFLYRTVPVLRDNPQVDLIDHVSGQYEGQLPPKGEYTYRLHFDREEDVYTCEATVEYGEDVYTLPVSRGQVPKGYRDPGLEALALEAAKKVFPTWSPAGVGIREATEDALFEILTIGTAEMERYGRVLAESDFPGIRVRSVPRPSFSVYIDAGLLDLSITTEDLTEEELLEILAAYRKKKRYVRLRSGDFVDLENDPPFESLDEMLSAMHITLEEAIAGHAHMPLFRALYVNQLLEEHEEMVAARDKTFRALIKNFKTIKDSDYEIPEQLEKVFRPYQVYGYKWLRTLAGSGFGGILADEMGLGKTAQMLSLLSSIKAEEEGAIFLVVCPASLVFNWKEEAGKFAPELSVVTLSGTVKEREELLMQALQPDHADLYICSYDIARGDITRLKPIQFNTVVLDEAQYIKNAKAAQTKSVKVLSAKHRFALTGTPIENRLSELWSIMDFLMPGFLFSQGDFQKTYEIPIMKYKDEEMTQKLSAMTGPFILRRLKQEVLKELPEKMEEVRTARMETEQRRLYDAQVVSMKQLLEGDTGKGEDKIRILAEIMKLRQLCCDPSLLFEDYGGKSAKREMCLDLIESAMDGGHRMLLFSQFTSMLAILEKDLQERKIPYFKLTGSTPKQERLRLVNEFNENPDIPVFLISLKAGGTGLNLTGADIVIHYDPWWNVAVQNQATDRAHRIGQTKQVTVYKLVASETIEEKIVELQETKKELADAILAGESQSLMSLSPEELLELLS